MRRSTIKIREILKKKKTGTSFEFFPPKSAGGRGAFMGAVRDLAKYSPLYVSVTYGPGGTTRERTVNTLKWIREETDLTVMSHLTCIGETRATVDALLNEFIGTGIDNILALRGDPPRDLPDFDSGKGEFRYAKDLVEFIKKYDAFSIAVAVYPEGHPDSSSLAKDMEYTKMKIDAGADFGIAQMFFDNRYFYDFMDRAEKAGITIPILPGIMPVTDIRKIEEFARICGTTVPDEIKAKMYPLIGKPEEILKIGIEFAVRQCEDLLDNGVTYLHFYTLNRPTAVAGILDALM